MQDKSDGSKTMTWVAACVFSLILGVVLIAFQPARELICGRYEVEGTQRLLAYIRGSETNCFWGYLYDFQTLITGLTAVTAASATIKQMRKDGARQAQQHLEAMTASLWEQNITQMHLRNILPIQLQNHGKRMKDYLDQTDPITGLHQVDGTDALANPSTYKLGLLSVRALLRVLEDNRFEGAHLVMSTSMLENFDSLKDWLSSVDKAIGLPDSEIWFKGLTPNMDHALIRAGVAECYDAAMRLLADFRPAVETS